MGDSSCQSGCGHSHGHGPSGAVPSYASPPPPPRDIWSAAKRGDLSLVRTLIEEEGVDVNIQDEDGSLPLHWAAYFDRIDVILYLLQKGASMDAPNEKEGQTPLHWACIGKSTQAIFTLVKEGADVTKCDKRGYDSLTHTCQYGNALAAHFLISQHGCPVGHTDTEGHTPLHWASYQNHEGVARLLLSLGADINAADYDGLTPLHWAALKGHYQMVYFLIMNGASTTILDKDGFSAEDLALQKNMKNTAKLIASSKQFNMSSMDLYWRFWFIYPWLFITLVFYLVDTLPFLLVCVVIAAVVYTTKRFAGYTFLGKETNNPTFMSIMFSSYAFSTWFYFNRVFPYTYEYSMLTLFFITVNVFWALTFIYLVRSDPGVVQPNNLNIEEIYQRPSSIQEIPQFCPTCMATRPIRSKHCRACNRCVARMDHHCTWLNNCVGANNHSVFLLIISLVFILHFIFVFFCIQVLQSMEGAPSWWAIHRFTYFYYSQEPVMVVLLVYHLFNAFWEMYVWYQQITCVLHNVTANEYINAHRYSYLRDQDNRFYNPFDKGKKENIKEFFFNISRYHTLYFLPPTPAEV